MLIDKNMFKLFDAEGGGAAGAAATDQSGATPQEDDKSKGTTTDDKSKGSDNHDDGVELDPKHVTVDEDGQLVFKAGDSVYKGKDINELLEKISGGVTEKDSVIKKGMAKEKVKLPDSFKNGKGEGDEEPEVVLRTREEIVSEVAPKILRQLGVDGKMLGWSDKQWDDYAEEHGLRDYKIMRMQQQVDRARDEINSRVNEISDAETRKVAIAEVINEEHEQVTDAIADCAVPQDILDKHFDYEAILGKVIKDKENYNRFGNLKAGRILGEVTKVLRKLEREHAKPVMQKKIEEDVERGNRNKLRIPSPGAGAEHKSKIKPYASMEDALDAAKKEHGLR